MYIMTRLGFMMFLQFFVWGAWYTSIAVYMTAGGMGDLTHWPFTVNPIAAFAALIMVGFALLFNDRIGQSKDEAVKDDVAAAAHSD